MAPALVAGAARMSPCHPEDERDAADLLVIVRTLTITDTVGRLFMGKLPGSMRARQSTRCWSDQSPHPFRGDVHVQPDGFERLLEQFGPGRETMLSPLRY